MKFLYILLLIGSCQNSGKTVSTENTSEESFPVALYFGSICCGPSSADFISPFVKKYNAAHKQKITGHKVGGCGREGEYIILFNLPAMNKSDKDTWLADLETLVSKQVTLNKAAKADAGGIEIRENVQLADLAHCRVEMAPYSF